ncbi:hypothetical protein CR194_03885 [Salipaludibacillus keqinensis]|uniref:EfeO-type cupredoxin-like domain-containing protein n=1 Tax=Salipaludibacillus keqinensis TaxID=2045207 RepID=A0A323TIG7_9BACI|nr:cupredoxin domain-containing protein [Salipaludibacillus keqinensis]PYZ94681.1 hypothetical protein CR194_03885 [Salipaludibacillus keqinensis]
MKIITARKKPFLFLFIGLLTALGLYLFNPLAQETMTADESERFVLNMVTGEFKSETESGEELESYRWDPGTLVIPKGEPVTLSIFGVNGKEHPFIIEGTDVTGTVKKGEETVLHLQFNEPGTYRLICTTHATIENNGPMIAYLVVK